MNDLDALIEADTVAVKVVRFQQGFLWFHVYRVWFLEFWFPNIKIGWTGRNMLDRQSQAWLRAALARGREG